MGSLVVKYCLLLLPLLLGACVWFSICCVVLGVVSTVVPTKSDSDVILCLQLLSKTITCNAKLEITCVSSDLSIRSP